MMDIDLMVLTIPLLIIELSSNKLCIVFSERSSSEFPVNCSRDLTLDKGKLCVMTFKVTGYTHSTKDVKNIILDKQQRLKFPMHLLTLNCT